MAEVKISALQNLEFKVLVKIKVLADFKFLAFQNLLFKILADFKILAFQNLELNKIFADFKILAFQNLELKILADFKILGDLKIFNLPKSDYKILVDFMILAFQDFGKLNF